MKSSYTLWAGLAFHYAKTQMQSHVNLLNATSPTVRKYEGYLTGLKFKRPKPGGRRGCEYVSYQSQNSIFTLEVDGDIWFDKVAGEHGDPDPEVGW